MSIISRLKASVAAFRAADVSTLSQPTDWLVEALCGVKSASGKAVSHETALRATAVLSCINILTEDLATLPLRLYIRTKNGSQYAVSHPLFSLLYSSPNPEMTSWELRAHMVLDMMLTGNFFNMLDYDSSGQITQVTPMAATCVAVRRTEKTGQLVFDYNDPNPFGTAVTLTADHIWRGQKLSEYGIVGRAPILLAREAIGLALAAEEQGARFFSNGAQVSGFLQAPEGVDLSKEKRDEVAKAWNSAYAGSGNAMKTALLMNGLKYEKISLTPQESQYLESRKFQAEEIARIYRIPSVMLGIDNGKSSTYASASEFFSSYQRHTLLPWCTMIEQSIHRDLLTGDDERRRYYAKHNFDDLLRPDQKARFETYKIAIDAGIMSRNECREKEELNWQPGLDSFNSPAPAPAPAPNNLQKVANAAAERIVRKEAKSGKFDPAFVVEVMQITPEQAKAYCDQRASGAITEAEAAQKLVSLAMEEQ